MYFRSHNDAMWQNVPRRTLDVFSWCEVEAAVRFIPSEHIGRVALVRSVVRVVAPPQTTLRLMSSALAVVTVRHHLTQCVHVELRHVHTNNNVQCYKSNDWLSSIRQRCWCEQRLTPSKYIVDRKTAYLSIYHINASVKENWSGFYQDDHKIDKTQFILWWRIFFN